MNADTPLTSYLDALDATFLKRLVRPLVQPGLMDHALAKGIVERSQRFSDRLPLSKLAQHRVQNGYGATQIPIVYAQPLPPTTVSSVAATSPHSTTNTSSTTVVQAKYIQPTASFSTISNNTIQITSSKSSNNTIQTTLIEIQDPSESTSLIPQTQESASPLPNTSSMTFVQESAQTNSPAPSLGVTEKPVVIETKDLERSPAPVFQTTSLPKRRVIPPYQPAQKISETTSLPITLLNPPLANSNSAPSSSLTETTIVRQHPIVYVQFPTQLRGDPSVISDSHELSTVTRTTVRPRTQLQQEKFQPTANRSAGAIATPLKRIELPTSQQSTSSSSISKKPQVTATQPINQPETIPLLFASPSTQKSNLAPLEKERFNSSNVFSESLASNLPDTEIIRPIRTNGTISTNPIVSDSASATQATALKPEQSSKVDIDAIANQVERKLMRRLVVERERRGQMTWKR